MGSGGAQIEPPPATARSSSFFALTVLLGAFFAARVITAIVVAEYARTSTLEEKTRSSEPNVASGKTRGEKRARRRTR